MSSNNFEENFSFGVHKYRHLLEILYKRYCYEGRYVFVDKSRFSTLVQRKLKTDTVIQKHPDVSYGIEEKVVSWPVSKNKPHTAFFLETRSCTNKGYESPGWMKTSCADYLLYAFEIKSIGLDVYLLDFPILQRWFWDKAYTHLRYPFSTMRDKNRTEGKLVPIIDITRSIPVERFLLTFDGVCKPLRLGVDILSPLLKRKIDALLTHPSLLDMVHEDSNTSEATNKTSDDWREVQNRVEEILAQQEAERVIQWVEEMEKHL